MDTNILNSEREKWDSIYRDDTYVGVGSDYEGALRSHYGKFLLPTSRACLISMGLHGDDCFQDIEKDGGDWDVLEIGCSSGLFGASNVAPFVHSYRGVDISARIVQCGNDAIEKVGVKNMKLYAVPDSDLSFLEDGQFDFIFSSAVFIHTHETITRHYLRETNRLLKDDGFFCHHLNMSDVDRRIDSGAWREGDKRYTEESSRELFEQAGLEILGYKDGPEFQKNSFLRWHYGKKAKD